MGTCPNQGCILQVNQTCTQLWSCQNQSEACGYYCQMCVQSMISNCQIGVSEDVNQKTQVLIIHPNQQRCDQPDYNSAQFGLMPTTLQAPAQLTLNQEIQVDKKLLENQIFPSFYGNSQLVPQVQTTVSLQPSQEDQTYQNVKLQPTYPSSDLISPQDYTSTIQMPQKVDEAQSQVLIQTSRPSEQKILGQNQDYLNKLKVNYDPKPPTKKWPTLPEIKSYLTKRRIIDFIVKNEETPLGYKLKKDFEGLKCDQLAQFKDCYKNYQAISFIADDLFDEEIQLVSQLFIDNKVNEEISKITLIDMDLVKELCNSKEIIWKKETQLLDLICKHSSGKKNEEVIKLINQDDYELVKVLIQAYKEKKDDYHQITTNLKEKHFAKNFESSQELKDALQQIDEEEQRKPGPVIIKQKILGLDQDYLNKLEIEVVGFFKYNQTLEDDFIVYICDEFKLHERKSELIEFCEQFNPTTKKWPTLPEIKFYLTKRRIIDFIVKDEETPLGYKLTKDFEKLKVDQLAQFKDCYKNYQAISFKTGDLFDEEIQIVSFYFIKKLQYEEISKSTLIYIDLVRELCTLQQNPIFKKVIELVDLIRKHSTCKTNEEVINLIEKDDQELVKVLIQTYKDNKEEYLQITRQLKEQNFAKNFERSQEITDDALKKIDDEEARRRLPLEPINIEQQILGLDKNAFEKLQEQVIAYFKKYQTISDAFSNHLCVTFSLKEKQQELIEYLKKFNQVDTERKYPDLPKIAAYQTKKNIIDLIVANQIPQEFELKDSFENLEIQQLNQFKDCNKKFKAISFVESDLFDEERQQVLELLYNKYSIDEISKIKLIHIDLVEKIYVLLIDQLKCETDLICLIREQSSYKTDDEVVQLIQKDDDELVMLLIKIFKKNKKSYHELIDQLRIKKYAKNFEQCQLQQLITLFKLPDLNESTEHQKKVLNFLDHFLNKDLVVFLMLLHDFTDIGQSDQNKNIEQIILSQAQQDFRVTVVQLLILEMDQKKKIEVIESKKFEDSREKAELNQLTEQIEHYLAQQFQKKNIEEPVNEEQFQCDFVNSNKLEMSEDDEFNTIQAISNITSKKIQVHSKSELTKKMLYTPEDQEANGTLYLVRDDLKKVFYVMIQYENEKKLIDSVGLQALKQKYPFISQIIPEWLNTFIKLPSLRLFLDDSKADSKRMLEDFFETQMKFLQIRDEAYTQKLYDAAVKLNLDSQLMQEWFKIQEDDKRMNDFCSFMINKGIRHKSEWATNQTDNIQQYFPMNAHKQTLKDFNRVQTYQEADDRKDQIDNLKSKPEELTSFIINTLYGVILRKDDISQIQSDIEEKIKGLTISLRFLVSYLLQSADMGLRARLNFYLCQNKSVPLIMNCQRTFKHSNFMNYNQELVFSISDNEGVGVFAFGIGKHATIPCGKSEISNLIVTPKNYNKSFDVQDLNVFSNGQIDVFFEKCYQKKSGWVFMDGQGQIPDSSLLSVLHLTNVVLIHFFEKDSNDQTSVDQLADKIKMIKDCDATIQVCLILRDCIQTKEVLKSDYPNWLPCKEQVEKFIELTNIVSETRLVQKSTKIDKVILFFNNSVREIQSKNQSKFTKENFLNGFCKTDSQGKDTYKRITDILKLTKDFIQEVQVLKENVFDQQGLPSLQIKDQIREISVQLRQFESYNGEDIESSLQREVALQSQLKNLTEQIQNLEVNRVMQQFWKIVSHDDAVQIKIELSKSLSKFTQENIQDIDLQKKQFMDTNGKNTKAKNGGLQLKEEIQKANDEYKQKMRDFEDIIFKRSLSYEYFWRSLICVMVDSKQCNFWTDNANKFLFKNAVKQQMLDGDTFELIDGRNLEMRADIIREIIGYEIECTKCIVVCVIGPQSTGKSTLMNFCFGTQFLASTGRCTQGIYFTLQKIPPEMKNGSDVDYLIILDTEGLNSPERAEGDRPDSEYDRKIVLFTLLCSDFLIINSSGDMSLQMKELIKICAVRYDELRAHIKAPKILYTFVRNSDSNPQKFKDQIIGLREDVIESSDEPTISNTAVELMSVDDDSVKVLGNAYVQNLIEKDLAKGILDSTNIIVSAPVFGVEASKVWLQVQNFIQSGQHQFRQIGKWLSEAGEHWSLIDRHGANITQFGNVQQMKNDRKIKQYISQLWTQYINTQITSKDSQKAEEKCRELYEKFKDGDDIESLKKKFIDENDKEKENDFFNFIEDKYSRWKLESSQRTITVGAELQQIKFCEKKMEILKNDYKLLIENKFKELQMTQIHTSAISGLYRKARNLYQVIKKLPEVDQDKQINEEFEKSWGKLEKEISCESNVEKMRKTNVEYLSTTFKSVNKFMSEITQVQYKNILEASDSLDINPNSKLPIKLVDYLVNHISHNAFNDENKDGKLDTKGQFLFDLSMLGMLIEDPKQRIFGQSSDAVQEKYLCLQKMLKVDYTYFIINDFEEALSKSSVFQVINQYLNIKKEVIRTEMKQDYYRKYYSHQSTVQVDDVTEIVNNIFQLFQELGQAGFGIEREVRDSWQIFSHTNFVPLGNLNMSAIFLEEKMQNNPNNKKKWIDSLKKNMRQQNKHFKQITPRVLSLLSCDEVYIPNQLLPNISFAEHQKESKLFEGSKHTITQPKLSFKFSCDDKYGKIDVKKFLEEKKLGIKFQQYYECLVRPKQYNMAESFKWTYLSELANAVVDWKQIVLDIDQSVSPQITFDEKKTQNKDPQANMKIDLKNVLERNLMNIEQAETIQTSHLQPIKTQLEYEVRQKLSLYVNHKLSGVITWVACVIIWYKQQKNILTIFNEEIVNIKGQKHIVLKKFSEIAKGQTTATTAQFADDIFTYSFNKFNDVCLKETNQVLTEHLESQLIKDMFDTETVYKQMDEFYINQAGPNEYQNCIKYATEPVLSFSIYVHQLKMSHIVKRQEEEKIKYQERVLSNLKTLQERLLLISLTMKNYEDQKDDSINFFEITKAGKKIENDEEKEEIVNKMSPILLNTLRKILDGTYSVQSLQQTLIINNVATEYSFNVKQKDFAKNIQGSPYNDLQNKVFDNQKPQEFLNAFFKRLDACKDTASFGECKDLRFMVGKLNDLLEEKISEIEGLTLSDIKTKVQDDITHTFVTNAIGCKEVCKFCNRKCELAPHSDDNENHNCNKRGHSLRVFGGGTLATSYGVIYPSLTTCDEIQKETRIKIFTQDKYEVRTWQEIHNAKNRNWTTNYTKFLPHKNSLNPDWEQMYQKLENFWKIHGKQYCTENKYTFIEQKSISQIGQKSSQMTDSQIIIICLDDSGSMFNSNQDFAKAVQGGKELEQYLKKNHIDPSQVHIQLWFNDCQGVNRVYKGQLSNTIPSNLWIRTGCQGDDELGTGKNFDYGRCGQFTGAVRILNQEVNNLLQSTNYNSVYWFFFTDGGNTYPHDELNALEKTMSSNRARWTDKGSPKLHPMIITNRLTVPSLCQMKLKIDEMMKEIWQEDDACALKQNIKIEQLAETMIEQFTFN